MEKPEIAITFLDTTAGEANAWAGDLETELQQLDGIRIRRRRQRKDTQDFGATLVLALGTASVTALAHGIASWLRRNSGAAIEITADDGSRYKFTNLNSRDAAVIAKAINSRS
jgi:hypothetical protein